MADSAGDKSFEPTAHRRQQAREQGQVAFSQDLGSAVLLVVGTLLLMMFGGRLIDFAAGLMRRELEEVATLAPGQSDMLAHFYAIMHGLSGILLPLFGFVLLAAILANVFQIGFL